MSRELPADLDVALPGFEAVDGAHVVQPPTCHEVPRRGIGTGHDPGGAQRDGVHLRGAGQRGPALSSQAESREGQQDAPRKEGGRGAGRQDWYLVGGVGVPHNQLPVLRGTYQQPGERTLVPPNSPFCVPLTPTPGRPRLLSLTWSRWPSAWRRSWPGVPLASAVSASALVPPPLDQTPAAGKGALEIRVRTSLAVQWLRLHAPNTGGTGSIRGGWGTEIPQKKKKEKRKSGGEQGACPRISVTATDLYKSVTCQARGQGPSLRVIRPCPVVA